MIHKTVVFFLVSLLVGSCFLSKDFRTGSFTYNQGGQAVSMPLLIPKGFVREERQDTAGVTYHAFYYAGGAVLYAAHVNDTAYRLQPLDDRLHQPQIHRLGGWVYKGVDENELFYREIQQGNLRFGYRKVPGSTELLFDSATNFASLQKPLR